MTSSSSSGTKWWSFVTAVVVVVLLHQLCFLTTTTTAAASSRVVLSNETDRMALLEFKSMITGDPLGVLSSWNASTHFCEWYGVICSKRHVGRVRVLDLPSEELSGSISPHIGNLSFLTKLILNNNSFNGGIPPEIGRLRRLEKLGLFNNSLEGEIPSNISGCSALTWLEMGKNKLVGQLPWQIGSLSKLQHFQGSHNYLTGSIPPAIGNWSFLQVFTVTQNYLSGGFPDALGQSKSLRYLFVQANNLSGEIPASIFNLSSLLGLSFGLNQLHGELPRNLGISLPNLQSLDVASNQFTGSIPASLSNASNIYLLQLPENNFTGSVPYMGSSQNLETFLIYENSLGSVKGTNDLSFLSSLTNASSLKRLVIYGNSFGGSLPEQIGNLSTNLEMLSVSDNTLSGSIPSGIQNLVSLQDLDASNNYLSGTIPSIIGNMQNLGKLGFSGNNISGSIPSSIGNLTSLLELDLHHNFLQGGIPVTIGNCKNLIVLDISYNNLNGIIPSEVMSISSLSIYLNLSHNHLTGALPIEMASLKNLGSLDLSHNMLSGDMPTSIGSCLLLESLYLQGNHLQGAVPSSLSSLRGIQQLDISSNNLSGQIPRLFEGMQQLQFLNLSYNNFEGEVPSNGVLKNVSIISVVGNSRLCGGVAELNLPPCKFKNHKKTLSHKLIKIVISTISGLLFLAFMGSCLLIFWSKKRGKQDIVSADDSQLILSYHDLYKATDGFSATNLIGAGSFGSVYKGVIDANGIGNTSIAVKVFNLQRIEAFRSFVAECSALKNIRHRNLLRILTVCSGVDYQMDDFKALIYEFLAHGSLEDWLHPVGSTNEPLRSLNFLQRLNVAVDVASAVDYLHHQCETPIVHCDLKPNNVLLDDDMVAHVGDFGLARFIHSVANPSSVSHASSSIGIKGTIGYAPPEYGMGNEVSIQGDVYSYGVLLLEIFTGMRPTDETFKEGLNIHKFVRSALSEKLIARVVDPILLNELPLRQVTQSNAIASSSNSREANYNYNSKGQILEEALISILEVGVACSLDSPSERITMSEVASRLLSLKKLLHDRFARRQRGVR